MGSPGGMNFAFLNILAATSIFDSYCNFDSSSISPHPCARPHALLAYNLYTQRGICQWLLQNNEPLFPIGDSSKPEPKLLRGISNFRATCTYDSPLHKILAFRDWFESVWAMPSGNFRSQRREVLQDFHVVRSSVLFFMIGKNRIKTSHIYKNGFIYIILLFLCRFKLPGLRILISSPLI